jgi:hypothetical protein
MAPGLREAPPRVTSPPPLPPNTAALPFTNGMHTFVHGCSWGSFGNLAGLGGSPFGSATNLAALGAAAAAGGGSGMATPTGQGLPPAHPPGPSPHAKAAASGKQEPAAQQHHQQQRRAGQQQQLQAAQQQAAAPPPALQLTPPAPQARRATGFLRAVFSEPSLNGTSA